MAKRDRLVVAVELGDSPATATTNGGGEGTVDLDDEVLLCGGSGYYLHPFLDFYNIIPTCSTVSHPTG